jgi:hypothetical protein
LPLEDINLDGAEISYLSATGNRLVPAVSPSEADFVSVELYRDDVSFLDPVTEAEISYDVVTADDQRGIISMIFSSSTRADKRLISVEFDYFPVNYDQRHTYLLKSVPEAWEELKNGMGYIALNEDEEANTIFIRRVELAYYDSYTAQEFLQPIYIFRGDNGGNGEFVAYVSAIHSSHIQQGR